jgi:ubiquinone/menaquinone biosynthesis C-methylase UbiE
MVIFAHERRPRGHGPAHPPASGVLLHDAARYDAVVWWFTLGREGAFRERILRRARLAPGESVLDVGCGTGGLAIHAKRRVGPSGKVCAIDASPDMLARAVGKARKAGADIQFSQAPAQVLPFPDAQFDLVLCTLMLHHVPGKARESCLREMSRVLKPAGRLLVVDFLPPEPGRRGPLAHFQGHRHGHVATEKITALLEGPGLEIVESGPLGYRDLNFVLATARGRS